MTVISDRKEGIAEGFNPYQTTHYRSIVKSAQDYYAFGQEMPGRSYNSPEYRYGFNGKEKDESGELGSLTHYDYGFRIYNPGIGRFLSVDPLARNFPFYTPYQFAGNEPIIAIDLDGKEAEHKFNAYLAMEEALRPGLSQSDVRKVYRETLEAQKFMASANPKHIAIGAGTGVVIGLTGGAGIPALKALFYRSIIWGTNPIVQANIAGAGGLFASLIDPNPAADYPGNLDDLARTGKIIFAKLSSEGVDFLKSLKAAAGVRNSANTAVARYTDDITGESADFFAFSGKDNNGVGGSLSITQDATERIFKISKEQGRRFNDTEAKILEEIASKLGAKVGDVEAGKIFSEVRGEITIGTELVPCPSCTGIIEKFKNLFPNIRINIASSNANNLKELDNK